MVIVHDCYLELIFPPWQWVMTDAKHDSTANAYHSTVVCLAGTLTYSVSTQIFLQLLL